MPKTIKITLDEQDFLVPRLTFGQQEDLVELWDEKPPEGGSLSLFYMRRGKRTAEIVLRRAMPPIGDLSEIECSAAELNEEVEKIFAFSRLKRAVPAGEAEPKSEV